MRVGVTVTVTDDDEYKCALLRACIWGETILISILYELVDSSFHYWHKTHIIIIIKCDISYQFAVHRVCDIQIYFRNFSLLMPRFFAAECEWNGNPYLIVLPVRVLHTPNTCSANPRNFQQSINRTRRPYIIPHNETLARIGIQLRQYLINSSIKLRIY